MSKNLQSQGFGEFMVPLGLQNTSPQEEQCSLVEGSPELIWAQIPQGQHISVASLGSLGLNFKIAAPRSEIPRKIPGD